MAFTTDMTTDIGKVRLLLMDLDSTAPIYPLDTQIQAFLDLEMSVKSAAALAMETLAGNRALVLQVITILDLKTDGFSVCKGLLASAKQLRDTDDSGGWAGFDIAEVTDDSIFVLREKYWKMVVAQSH